MPINIFFNEGVKYKLKNINTIKSWIKNVILSEKMILGDICIIFCDDNYLSKLNYKYLKHKTLTDVITFDYTKDNGGKISGDIFISIDRVFENSSKYSSNSNEELYRVIIHGILHLLGYNDKLKSEKQIMRQKEDISLSLRK